MGMGRGVRQGRWAGVVALVAASMATVSHGSPSSGASQALAVQPWPGGQAARTVDVRAELGTDVSGLSFRAGATVAGDVLWGVDNRDGLIHRLVLRSGAWRPTASNGWSKGKRFTFPDGRVPDAEGLAVRDGVAWVSTERDSTGTSRPSILRVPLGATTTRLGATREWRLTKEFPGLGGNAGLEALDLVPDAFLVARGFIDEARGARYDPAAYPGKVGGGVFFVAAEAAKLNGQVRGYVLRGDGTAVRVATVANPLGLVRALEFDADAGQLWIVCDDDCAGRSAVAQVRGGRFVATAVHARPTGLFNGNNEGFTVAPASRCASGSRPVFWSNDANNAGHAIWAGTLPCPTRSAPVKASTRFTVTAPQVQAGRRARVTVSAARSGGAVTGQVTVVVGRRTRTATLTQGRATVPFGTFRKPGRRKVTVSYPGSATHTESTTTSRLQVVRATTRLTPVAKRVRVARGTRARLAARIRTNGLPARGRVVVRVDGRAVRATVRRQGGRLVVRTPVLRQRSRHTVTVRYRGSAATTPARATFVVRVR